MVGMHYGSGDGGVTHPPSSAVLEGRREGGPNNPQPPPEDPNNNPGSSLHDLNHHQSAYSANKLATFRS